MKGLMGAIPPRIFELILGRAAILQTICCHHVFFQGENVSYRFRPGIRLGPRWGRLRPGLDLSVGLWWL